MENILLQSVTFGAPVTGGIQGFYAFLSMRERDPAGPQPHQFRQPFIKKLEEAQFKSFGLHRKVVERDLKQWRSQIHPVANVLESDFRQNLADAKPRETKRKFSKGPK